MHNGAWFAEHFFTCAQHLNNKSLSLLNRFSCKLCIRLNATSRSDDFRCIGHNATIATNDSASGQLQFTPPNNVGDVAKGTDHGNACAFFYLCKWVSKYGHFNVEEWCANGGSKQRLVTLVVGVGYKCNTCRQQFGSRGVNKNVGFSINRCATGEVKRQRVVRPWAFTIFQFCLRNCSIEINIPQCWSFLHVRLTALQVVKKCALTCFAAAFFDGCVEQRPVDRQTKATEKFFKNFLIFVCEYVAQLNEVRP